ncbi:unnamed protein product [Mycena citricolor]|uniref:DUF6535 domain-containing protein n=1 Tax=Mycena citricolor TaxID=2018698 RepID=A0AAD2HLG8_9AGAR|nr:unnamed protein product [Mycena citricolor]
MSQADRPQTEKQEAGETYSERERASGNKLWSIYISEAQSYDQGLIDGWRSEMDGLLIFAGLFSGVVTTFIIDSYKTLNPDSGSQTVVLLSQISHQLAIMNNGTAVTDSLPPLAAFSPPVSSLICNALWFTSLALSLSSALVATLVDQWAQEYRHRTTMSSSPSVRSRVYIYLFPTLQSFNMHAVVGVPPLLLHWALVLFFAGLVAFLVPINIIIMGISSALLLLFVLVYATFTVLPLFSSDSPFQTPLTRILWSLIQSLRAYIRTATPEMDHEALTKSRPQSHTMIDAMRLAARKSNVERETWAIGWTIQSLSDDVEFEQFVEVLPYVLWNFDRGKPCSTYQTHFQRLLQDSKGPLGQRLADFMAGSNSYLLEDQVRLRRQLSVLRAIWAICAFSLHTGSLLQSPIGDADVDNALLASKFLDSPDVQGMLLDVSALIRLNMIESRSWERLPAQPNSSGGGIHPEAERQRQADMHRTYTRYLVALSQCAASFQREQTTSFFDRSQMHFTEANGFKTLQWALQQLIDHASDKAVDNVVFAARLMITPFAQTSEYPKRLWLTGLGPFLVRNASLAVYDPEFDSQPASKHHYTRYLCHKLGVNLFIGMNPQECVDALQLIYHPLLESGVPPRDFDTHLSILRTLQTQTADIRTHRLAAIVQCVMLKCFWPDLSKSGDVSEWEQLPSIFEDKEWFRSVLGLDNDKRTERASAKQIYECACLGVMTTLFEQCTAHSLDQTLKSVLGTVTRISSVIPAGLQRRFANAASAFIRKYPTDCLADGNGLCSVLDWAVKEDDGWMTNVDALRVLDTAVSEVQTDDQQKAHRDNAATIRGYMQEQLLPEDIFAAFISLVSSRK